MPLPTTVLTALRRQQLVDLARAYDIDVPAGATKRQMLPSLITAEQQSLFKQQPKYPWYLQKAMRNSDDPYVPLPANPEFVEAAPVIEVVKPAAVGKTEQGVRFTRTVPEELDKTTLDPTAPRRTRTGRIESDYHRKQRLLKAEGVYAFGWTKQAVDEEATKHGIV